MEGEKSSHANHLGLTHLSQMEFPILIYWPVHFRFRGLLGNFIFPQISIEHFVSEQLRPWLDPTFWSGPTLFYYAPQKER